MPIELRCPSDDRHQIHSLSLYCMECGKAMAEVSCEQGQLVVRAVSSKSKAPARVAFCFVDKGTREQLSASDAKYLHENHGGELELKGATGQSSRKYVLNRGEVLLAYQAGSEVLEV